jgi:hypothetical protein
MKHSRLFFAGIATLVACGSTNGESDEAAPPSPARVTLTVAVEGQGRVRSTPPGIDCPGACSAPFEVRAAVTLTSAPSEGWKLDHWSGDCAGAADCALTLDAPRAVKSSLAQLDPRWDPSVGAADCAAAWGAAGEKLSPCDTVKDHYVVVHKSKRNIALCGAGGALEKNFRTGLGFAPVGTKEKEGDGKTPEGVFYVATLLPASSYHRAFLFSYPTKDDAARGFASGLVTGAERDQIVQAQDACQAPPQTTALGGSIEIHGEGSSKDWTVGCVALENADVDRLWSEMGVGDTIVVVP